MAAGADRCGSGRGPAAGPNNTGRRAACNRQEGRMPELEPATPATPSPARSRVPAGGGGCLYPVTLPVPSWFAQCRTKILTGRLIPPMYVTG